MDEFVQLPVAQGVGEDVLAGMAVFPAAGDHPLFDQVHHSRAQQFRVNPQILMPLEIEADGVGDAAQAQLNRGPVRHHGGNVLPDGLGFGLGRRGDEFHQGGVMLHDGVHLGDVEQGIPEDPGHVVIDFHDQPPAVPGRSGDKIIDGPEAEKAGPVHGGDGGDRDVHVHEIPDQPRDLMELVGDEQMLAGPHLVPLCPGNEPAMVVNQARQVGRQDGGGGVGHGQESEDVEVLEVPLPHPVGDGRQERRRFAAGHAVHDGGRVFDRLHRLLRGGELAPVCLPVHDHSPCMLTELGKMNSGMIIGY